ncbi:MAG TPA: cell envelope integrity protein CreD [Steroidobacteraceae bacterium]|nr:cell envelope integrity protein CreD [Steroidobacteraceae bacterium]
MTNPSWNPLVQRLLPIVKVGAILFLTLLLLAPMAHIRQLIGERQGLRDSVLQEVARSDAYAQKVTGPVLVIPYVRTLAGNREVSGELRLLPERLDLDGSLATEERRRGIYRARVYRADTRLTGHFEVPAGFGVTAGVEAYRFGEPRLALGISDIRGIGNALALRTGAGEIPFQPGAGTSLLASGVHAVLPALDASAPQRIDYDIGLALTGTREFNVSPVGRETNVRLQSDWPHPSFVGEYLPRSRDISAAGFVAQWQTSFFATSMEEALGRCSGQEADCADFAGRQFGVGFIDPVDHYLKSERAAKYAFLFIGLTFACFFLTEVLRRVSVHPVQYGLVGLALAMFFLLLVAFSEHIGFAAAYAVSATACVGLITFYVTHVLASRSQGLGFGAGLAGLYGLLYGILSSEDYALLMGSLLVFGLLAAVMVLTRRVSWSGAGVAR